MYVTNISIYTIIYFLLTLVSFASLLVYRRFCNGKNDVNGQIAFLATTVVIFAYGLLSCSKTLALALFANSLSYAGTLVLLVFFFIAIHQFCGVQINKGLLYFIVVCTVLMAALVFTGGTKIKLYYTSVCLNITENLTTIIREYGPLHIAYTVYVFVILIIMLSVTFKIIKDKKSTLHVSPAVLILMVLQNIFIWFIERCVDIDLNILAVSYVLSEVLLLLTYKNRVEYEDAVPMQFSSKSSEEIINGWIINYGLTERESEVLQLLIDNVPRADIAEKLFISEHTVKKHTAHIYEKLCVSSRNDLLFKLNEELNKS